MSRNAKLLVVLAVFAGATLSTSLTGHGREATVAGASTRARIDSVFLPRAADDQTMAMSNTELSAQLYAMTHTSFEVEDWGDIPKIGLSVQDMTPFGIGWGGNKQIFWNPGFHTFQWDFKATDAKGLALDLTAAPDYGRMRITLRCFTTVPTGKFGVPQPSATEIVKMYDGYAASVQRRHLPLFQYGPCAKATGYRLRFEIWAPTDHPDRRLGGIDRIVVSK